MESRKRAPLYQKKQEEELKAAVEKAQECEVRAIEAELRAKEAAAETEVAQKRLAELQEEAAAVARAAARAAEEAAEKHALEVQRLNLENAVTQVGGMIVCGCACRGSSFQKGLTCHMWARLRESAQALMSGFHPLQERHEEALAALRTAVQEAEAARNAAQEALSAKEQQLAEAGEAAAKLRERIAEMEAAEGGPPCNIPCLFQSRGPRRGSLPYRNAFSAVLTAWLCCDIRCTLSCS